MLRILPGAILMVVLAPMARADLSGPYEPQHWSDSGIENGTTSIMPESGLSDHIEFGYSVDLGFPGNGVSYRTATYAIRADRSGILNFDYHFTGDHRFSLAQVHLEVFAETSGGTRRVVLADGFRSGPFIYTGTVQIEVEAGMTFGVIVGGGNADIFSRISGAVRLTNFSRPLALDGVYAMDHWSSDGIPQGTTEISPDHGDAVVGSFSYDVDLGNPGPGVGFRTANFSATAPRKGFVSFDYDFHGFHAYYQAAAYLEVFWETDRGIETLVLVDEPCLGDFEYTGSVRIPVYEGLRFGINAGGANYDSISWLQGAVDISNFSGPRLFDDDTRLEHWSSTGIAEGQTWTDPSSGPADEAGFGYSVEAGDPRIYRPDGVPFRTTEWSVVNFAQGNMRLDFDYTGDHGAAGAGAYLEAYSVTSSGRHSVVLVDEPVSGPFMFSRSVALPVQRGLPFGIIAGGGNDDPARRLDGVVLVSGFGITPCPGDFNGDGVLNTIDVLVFLNAWGSRDPSGDFNRDDVINTRDVLDFLNAWSSGC